MWRSMRWIVLVIFVAGLLSGGVGIAQDTARGRRDGARESRGSPWAGEPQYR